jgi:hypothetical protein
MRQDCHSTTRKYERYDVNVPIGKFLSTAPLPPHSSPSGMLLLAQAQLWYTWHAARTCQRRGMILPGKCLLTIRQAQFPRAHRKVGL